MSSKHVIGIDGGGTKTSGVLMREDGTLLAEVRFPGSNPHASTHDQVREVLTGLLDELSRNAGVTLSSVDALCLCMAGVDRPKDRALIEGMIRPKLAPSQKLIVANDAVAGIMAALDKPHGLMLISGTGSVCFGFHEDGRTSRCGGWGQLLGDEGSGYALGVAALKAVIQSFDGRLEQTTLSDKVLTALRLEQPTDVLGWLQSVNSSKPEIAGLSPLVHDAEGEGDAVARRILDQAADDLLWIIRPAHAKLFAENKEDIPIVFGGSNLTKAERYQSRVRERIAASGMRMTPTLQENEAVIGAAKFALLELRRSS
jgi:N-acetylglucosamine kinase-like BadF-type ATPase